MSKSYPDTTMPEREAKARNQTIKRTLTLIVLVSLVAIGAIVTIEVVPFLRIAKMSKSFEKVERGMSLPEVATIMASNYGSFVAATDSKAWWNQTELGPGADARITKSLRYSVDTFYLPVAFEFSFDENEMLVGKHRFD